MRLRRRPKTPWRQCASLICLLLFALSLWAPPAWTQPEPEKAKTGTSLEAWYYVADDSQEAPAPLPVIPDPVNPYGENTLHVGVVGGQEDARTYLQLDVEDLPVTFKLVAGTLTLPIAEDAATIGADASHVQVCLASPPAKAQEGSFDEPPEVDCKTKAPAPYREKPFPHLVVDLKPFAEDLSFSALAIVPSERAVAKQDTWHIAFYGKKNKSEGAKPITAELQYVEEDFSAPVVDTEPPETVAVDDGISDFGSSDVGSFDSGGSFDFDAGDASETPVEEPAARPPVVAQEQTALQPLSATRPGYNIVWAVPLLLLALYFYFGSALTKEVVLRWDR